jgi:hypothetical protein
MIVTNSADQVHILLSFRTTNLRSECDTRYWLVQDPSHAAQSTTLQVRFLHLVPMRDLDSPKIRLYSRFSDTMDLTFQKAIATFDSCVVLTSSDVYAGPSNHANSSSCETYHLVEPSSIILVSLATFLPRRLTWHPSAMTHSSGRHNQNHLDKECAGLERKQMEIVRLV